MFSRLISLSTLAALLLIMAPAQASPVSVSVQREDLADTNAGVDRWAAHYFVRFVTPFPSLYTLSLLFDQQRYTELQLGPVLRDDLISLVVQPDHLLMADGLVQFTALKGLIGGDTFAFDVVYGRNGLSNGAQGYEVLDSGFEFVASGSVEEDAPPGANLPEPGVLTLACIALCALAAQRRRPKHNATISLA